MRTDDFETAVVKMTTDLAAEVLRLALMEMEIKYDPIQPRAPKGISNGGQWVGGGSGGAPSASRPPRPKVRRLPVQAGQAARLLMSHPEAALGIQAIGLPAIGAGVALTRAVGGFDRQATGRDKTPFLKLPAGKLNLRIASDTLPQASESGDGRPYLRYERTRIDEECDELERDDHIKCDSYAAMYGRSRAAQKRIAHICYATAAERWAECKRNGGVSGINTPLFMGRR